MLLEKKKVHKTSWNQSGSAATFIDVTWTRSAEDDTQAAVRLFDPADVRYLCKTHSELCFSQPEYVNCHLPADFDSGSHISSRQLSIFTFFCGVEMQQT